MPGFKGARKRGRTPKAVLRPPNVAAFTASVTPTGPRTGLRVSCPGLQVRIIPIVALLADDRRGSTPVSALRRRRRVWLGPRIGGQPRASIRSGRRRRVPATPGRRAMSLPGAHPGRAGTEPVRTLACLGPIPSTPCPGTPPWRGSWPKRRRPVCPTGGGYAERWALWPTRTWAGACSGSHGARSVWPAGRGAIAIDDPARRWPQSAGTDPGQACMIFRVWMAVNSSRP